MRNKKALVIIILLLLAQGLCWAQDLHYEPGFDLGRYTPFSANHNYIADYHHYGMDLRIGKGQQGLLIGYTHNTLDSVIYYTHDDNRYGPIGECFSLAYFVEDHIYKGNQWSFDYDIIYGADLWTRHGNEMLGSALNFHVSFDLGPTLRITDQLDAVLRYGYYHSSNGATFLPDNGINSHFARVALRYHPKGRTEPSSVESHPFEKHNNLIISEGIGWLQTYTRVADQLPNETPFFLGNTFRVGFSRQFHPRFRWDVAADFMWTGETRYCHELEGVSYHFWNSAHLAASADIEAQFGRFAFCAGAAYYLYHGSELLPQFYTPYYERVGYKFYLGKHRNYYLGTFMKIHLNSIDYIEWTFGANVF